MRTLLFALLAMLVIATACTNVVDEEDGTQPAPVVNVEDREPDTTIIEDDRPDVVNVNDDQPDTVIQPIDDEPDTTIVEDNPDNVVINNQPTPSPQPTPTENTATEPATTG